MAEDAPAPVETTPAVVGPQVAGDGIPAAAPEAAPAAASEPKKPPPTAEDSVRAAIKTVAERARAPDGKFTKAAEGAEPAPAATTDSQQQAKPTPPPVIEPPAAAKGLLKATDWTKLPAPVRDALAKDLAALDSYVPEKVKGDVAFAQAVKQRMAPHEAAMRAAGFATHEQGLDYLFRLQEFASRDLQGYARWVAQQAGLQIAGAAQPAGSQPAPQPLPPIVSQLANEVQNLKAQQQRTISEQTDAQINAFAATKDATGQPAYPHFASVRAEMGRLIGAGMATNMKDAYEKAVFMDGSLREKVIGERAQRDATARIEAQKKAAAEAQRSASPPRGAPGSSQPLNGAVVAKRGEKVEDSVRNAFRRSMANA